MILFINIPPLSSGPFIINIILRLLYYFNNAEILNPLIVTTNNPQAIIW